MIKYADMLSRYCHTSIEPSIFSFSLSRISYLMHSTVTFQCMVLNPDLEAEMAVVKPRT